MTGIYKITNIINGKCYIGKSESNIEKRLNEHKVGRHSNEHLQRAIQKYGIENFTFEVLEECSKELCGERERFWISKYKSYDSQYGYNKTYGDEYRYGVQFNEETRIKLSQSMTGRKDSEYTKNLKRLGRLGKKQSEESKLKNSIAHRKENLSEETLEKQSNAHKRENLSKETLDAMSKSQKERMSNANNNPFYGKHHTQESKDKISNSRKEMLSKLSDDERKDMLGHTKDNIWVTNGYERHSIKKDELPEYEKMGYHRGMKLYGSTTIESIGNEKDITE